jgi:hypothetical protein
MLVTHQWPDTVDETLYRVIKQKQYSSRKLLLGIGSSKCLDEQPQDVKIPNDTSPFLTKDDKYIMLGIQRLTLYHFSLNSPLGLDHQSALMSFHKMRKYQMIPHNS